MNKLWQWFIEPSSAIEEPDQRRQAALLSGFLLATILLAIILELVTVAFIDWKNYTGYRQTIVNVIGLGIIYGISRTHRTRLAALLAVIVASTGVFFTGFAEPRSVLGGLLDFLILPLWLGSLYLSLNGLIILIFMDLISLLAFPIFAPEITLNDILVGPFSFIFATSVLLLAITHHRNMLERDRNRDLAEKELRYRTLVEQIPGITYVISINSSDPTDYKIIYLSPRFESWLGYPIADFYQDPFLWKKIVVKEDRERLSTGSGRHEEVDRLSIDEYRIVSRDNQTLWVRDMFRIRPGDTPDENIVQGILLNITEQKFAYEKSLRESERTAALLRVAGRLKMQLDLNALLSAISEEVCKALNTPVSIIGLYDQKQKNIHPAGGMGLDTDAIKSLSPIAKPVLDEVSVRRGRVFATRDIQATPHVPNLEQYRKLNFKSIAFAVMEYEQEMIGTLTALTIGEPRDFTEDELLLLQGIADQSALAVVNTSLYKDANRRFEQIQALRAIDIAISSNHNLQETLTVVLEQITKQLQVDSAVILLLDEARGQLEFGNSLGFQTSTLRFTSLRVGEGMAGRAAQQRQIIHIHDMRIDPQTLVNAPALAGEGFVSYYAAPLISQGKVKGVLELFHRSPLDPDDEWINFLETLAGQAAIAIESVTLFENLQQSNNELSRAYDSTIEGWSHALDLRDKETEGHTRRVTEMTLELARRFGFNETDLVHIRRGALLHDIGKMGVPDRILLKEGPLTDEEWVMMRQHPGYAHDMLVPIGYLRQSMDIPYCHHEKWDGSGYPRGLKYNEIPLTARIFAIVDVWDAVTSDRPYRAGWSREKALAHIKEGVGFHFDPQVVEVFIKLIQEKSLDK